MRNIAAAVALLFVSLIVCGCVGNWPANGGSGTDQAAGLDNSADTNKVGDADSNIITNLNQYVKAKAGDIVSVHYVLKSEDGNIIQSTVGEDPITFQLGTGAVIPGFEQALIGMKAGESKTVTVPPELGYGEIDRKKIITFDRNSFPPSKFPSLEVGMQVSSDTLGTGVIEKFSDKNVTVNFNNPMAGETLVFDILLAGISEKN